MPASIATDRRAEPLIVVTFPPEPVSDEAILDFIAEQRAIIRAGKRHFSVTDASRAVALPANQRRLLADWLKEAEEATRELVVGMAIVISNPLVRGGLTAVFWLRKPVVPTRVFATLPEAIDHALACLLEEGISITPRMRDLALELHRNDPSGR